MKGHSYSYLVPCLAAVLMIWMPSELRGAAEEPVPSITVVGTGKVSGKPDTGQINVGVVTRSDSAAKALRENNEALRAIFAKLTELGIAERDIQTVNLNLSPVYARRNKPQESPAIIGYEATNQVHVNVRTLANMGRILDALVGQGANRLNGIAFSVDDPEELLDSAREKAMVDARRKAELYAKSAGVSLGPVLSVAETTPTIPGPRSFRLARAAEAVPLAPGELEFSASITVVYRIQ